MPFVMSSSPIRKPALCPSSLEVMLVGRLGPDHVRHNIQESGSNSLDWGIAQLFIRGDKHVDGFKDGKARQDTDFRERSSELGSFVDVDVGEHIRKVLQVLEILDDQVDSFRNCFSRVYGAAGVLREWKHVFPD